MRVMFISQHFPNSNTSGNLTYLDALVSFLEAEPIEFKLVVLSERFPNNEFFFRYPEAPYRLDRLAFPRGRKLGGGLILKEFRPNLQNVFRRIVLALPKPLTKFISAWYFRQPNASTEDYFQPMDSVDLANALREIDDFCPDHLLLDSIKLTEIAKVLANERCQTYLIMHDLIYARLASLDQASHALGHNDLGNMSEKINEVQAKELESFGHFTHVLAIQKQEASYVKESLPEKSVLYVPMPARAIKTAANSTYLSKRCLFVGSQGISNVQGITWFLENVWPSVLKQVPEAVLDICGTCCAYLDNSYLPSVKLHGRVVDINKFYAHADACIIPLLGGSGMKIKLVDALAQGSACVTTTVGMQGLEGGAGLAFIQADEAEAFADAVVLLMTQQGKRDRLRHGAVAFVEEKLAPEAVFNELRGLVYQKTLSK